MSVTLGADSASRADDPWLWLEEIEGERALTFAQSQNEQTMSRLGEAPDFSPLRDRLLSILDSDARIPYLSKAGDWYYNFWRDAEHPRGLWRRTTLTAYERGQPDWQTVLDLDALALEENENWVWKGADIRLPEADRALLSLSRGGADATVVREFDLELQRFVSNGFRLEEAKSDVSWIDRDTLYVGTDTGQEGDMTLSGYPRHARYWQRGTAIEDAALVFSGERQDVWAGAWVSRGQGKRYHLASRAPSFFTSEVFLRQDEDWQRIDKPEDAELFLFGDQLLLRLKSAWSPAGTDYPAGALIAIDLAAFIAGDRGFSSLFVPGERQSLDAVTMTRDRLLLTILDNVNSQVRSLSLQDGQWQERPLALPGVGTVSLGAVDSDDSNAFFLTFAGPLNPTTLYLGEADSEAPLRPQRQLPHFFDTDGLQVEQFSARSSDGTAVPYFVIGPALRRSDQPLPTLLYAYGGFEVSLLPGYSAGVGAAWLEQGGVYVLANIRGGGEFGPDWHNAARRDQRQLAYDDLIAVAEDLIERGITSSQQLGVQGGSNGGLLTGVMLTQRPDLFAAVVSQVPLLDMRRYHRLLAGASWMDEYGDPDDPQDWAFISQYSPYHNLRSDLDYPPTLITTSTRDDRVHPGHARKMVARMQSLGHEVLYYENMEGGHGGAANNAQSAHMQALAYTFLWQALGKPEAGLTAHDGMD